MGATVKSNFGLGYAEDELCVECERYDTARTCGHAFNSILYVSVNTGSRHFVGAEKTSTNKDLEAT